MYGDTSRDVTRQVAALASRAMSMPSVRGVGYAGSHTAIDMEGVLSGRLGEDEANKLAGVVRNETGKGDRHRKEGYSEMLPLLRRCVLLRRGSVERR